MFDFTSPRPPRLGGTSASAPLPKRLAPLPTLACVLAPNLPVQVERSRHPHGPLLIAHPLDGDTVYAASSDARRAGVRAGLSLYEARKLAPLAHLIPPDEDEYHARHAQMHAALAAFSAAIETVALGEFLLDVRGLEGLHGGYAALAKAIHAGCASASRLVVYVGIAGGKFTAQQAARRAGQPEIAVVPQGGEARFLAHLPVSTLPNVPGEMLRRLALLDIHTLGQFASFRKPALLRQFGPQVSELYEFARGNDSRPLHPDRPPLRVMRSKSLDLPVEDRQHVLNLAVHLSNRISRALRARGYHAEALKLAVTIRHSGRLRLEASQAIKPPSADAGRLARAVMQMAGRLNISASVSEVSLCAYPLRHWARSAHQYALIRSVVSEKQAQVEAVMQAIWQRFGEWALKFASFVGKPVPVRVKVLVNDAGLPCLVTTRIQTYRVMGIDEEWQERGQWWATPIHRHYYRVMLDDGSLRNIYKNLGSAAADDWYLDRGGFIL